MVTHHRDVREILGRCNKVACEFQNQQGQLQVTGGNGARAGIGPDEITEASVNGQCPKCSTLKILKV